jgi:hypothetical protein
MFTCLFESGPILGCGRTRREFRSGRLFLDQLSPNSDICWRFLFLRMILPPNSIDSPFACVPFCSDASNRLSCITVGSKTHNFRVDDEFFFWLNLPWRPTRRVWQFLYRLLKESSHLLRGVLKGADHCQGLVKFFLTRLRALFDRSFPSSPVTDPGKSLILLWNWGP